MNVKKIFVLASPWLLIPHTFVHAVSSEERPKSALSYSSNKRTAGTPELSLESTIISLDSGLLDPDEIARINSYIRPRSKPATSLPSISFERWKIHCISTSSELDILAKRCSPSSTDSAPSELTLDAIILRALIFSPLLKSKQSLVDEKRWLLRQTFSSWYPNLSLSSGSILRTFITNRQNYGNPSTPVNPSASGNAFQPNNPISTTNQSTSNGSSLVLPYTSSSSYTQAYPVFTLNWTFYDPTRRSSIRAAQAALTSSELDTRYTAHQIIAQASQYYSQALVNEYAIAGLLMQNHAYKKLIETLERQVNSGYTPVGQLLLLKSEESSNLYNLTAAILQHVQAVESLKAIIGLPKEVNLFLSNDSFLMEDWPYSDIETEDLISSYPQVTSLYKQSEQYSRLSISQYRAYIPKLSVLGYTTYIGSKGSTSFSPPSQPSGAWSQQLSNYIGLNATWNIFDGFSSYQAGRSFNSQAQSYKKQAEDASLQLRQSISSALTLFKNRESLITPLRRSFALSVLAADSARKRVVVGLDDPSSLLNAEISTGQAITSFSQAYANILQSYFTLLDLSGASIYQRASSKGQ